MKDATNFFTGPFMSRLKYKTFFKAPTVDEAKSEIKRRINDTHGSKTSANFFIDPGYEGKVLDVIYKRLLRDSGAPKLPHRDIKINLTNVLDEVARNQGEGVSLHGRRVNLSVDEHDNLRAEWRDYF